MGCRNLTDAASRSRRGESDSTVTRTCQATGETLLVPARNHRSKVNRITGSTGKSIDGERVTDGSAVAMKRSNVRGATGPAVCNVSGNQGGKDEMIKASNDLQDLRRRIYVKAKAETTWRFWGLYVHVCKMETLRTAYALAEKNDGAPGVDGVTFAAIEKQGVDAFLEQIANELRDHLDIVPKRQLMKRLTEWPEQSFSTKHVS